MALAAHSYRTRKRSAVPPSDVPPPTSTPYACHGLPYEGIGNDQRIRNYHPGLQRDAGDSDKDPAPARPPSTADTSSIEASPKQHRAETTRMMFASRGYVQTRPLRPEEHHRYAWLSDTSLAYLEEWHELTEDMFSTPEPIPPEIQQLADYINRLPKKRGGGQKFPSRNTLKRDPRLQGEVSRKTGCLRIEARGSRLRKWVGDERLFEDRMWRFLTDEGFDGVDGEVLLASGGERREAGDADGGSGRKGKDSVVEGGCGDGEEGGRKRKESYRSSESSHDTPGRKRKASGADGDDGTSKKRKTGAVGSDSGCDGEESGLKTRDSQGSRSSHGVPVRKSKPSFADVNSGTSKKQKKTPGS